jgi:VanZ family protein
MAGAALAGSGVNVTFGGEAGIFKPVELKPDVPYLTRMIQRISAIAAWLALAFIVFVTLSPIGARPSVASPHLEHFAAFALTGVAFALAYPNRILTVVAIVVGTALGLEALQLLTPDRHARAADALVKAFGGISGICAGQLMYFLIRVRPIQPDHPI